MNIKKENNLIFKGDEINKLKNELILEKEKNKKLEVTINQLKQQNNIDAQTILKLSLENSNLKEEIKKNAQNNSNAVIKLCKKISELNEQIKDLNEKLNRYPFILEKEERILSIIFTSVSQKINYSIVCKNTDTIHKLEAELYKEYPELAETNYYFICKGSVVNKFKKLKELNIKNGDIIIINHNENED